MVLDLLIIHVHGSPGVPVLIIWAGLVWFVQPPSPAAPAPVVGALTGISFVPATGQNALHILSF